MAEPGRELSSINFEAMLGGPLVAVVNAQAQSAMTSVNFIKSVGFKPLLDGEGKSGNRGTMTDLQIEFPFGSFTMLVAGPLHPLNKPASSVASPESRPYIQ